MASYFDGSPAVYRCAVVDSSTGAISGCFPNSVNFVPTGVALRNNAYTLDGSATSYPVFRCVQPWSSCSPTGPSSTTPPFDMVISGDKMYITSVDKVLICAIDEEGAIANSCTDAGPGFENSKCIAFN